MPLIAILKFKLFLCLASGYVPVVAAKHCGGNPGSAKSPPPERQGRKAGCRKSNTASLREILPVCAAKGKIFAIDRILRMFNCFGQAPGAACLQGAAIYLVAAEKVAKDFFRKARRLPAALRASREQVAAGHSPRPVA
ncbi:MAG: hypothetical protein LBJ82_01740 [Deltaproteobacteria bacterium]|nr:hypothetical protein [Deltaproteobacteria bacterium]